MTPGDLFDNSFTRCPLVAILRGVRPDEVEPIADVLVKTGFTLIEVPLNSPDAVTSIKRLAARLGDRVLIGAGTVLTVEQVEAVAAAGGRLIVSPNCNTEVIAATRAAGMVSLPGCFTPSEAFAALAVGANAIKFFPAEGLSPTVIKAMRAVLPAHVRVLAVGGVAPDNLQIWAEAGVHGFGLGSALYAPGDQAAAVRIKASAFMTALQAFRRTQSLVG